MGKPLLWAALGIAVLGAGAMLAVYALSGAPAPARTVTVAPVPQYEPAPAAAPAPPPPPPTRQVVAEPVRAEPVAAPEYQERLESPEEDVREDAMLEMRQQRRAKQLEWLNRRRNP